MAASLQVTISSGTSGSISIRIEDDSLYEGDETLTVTFAATNAVFASGVNTDTVTITDNESKPEINFKNTALSVEEGAEISLSLVASVASEANPTIGFAPTTVRGDFLNISNGASGTTRTETVVIRPNSDGSALEGNISIATNMPNNVDEADGEISVVLVGPASSAPYTIGTRTTATVTIRDVDVPELTIQNAADVNAGSIANFQITSDIRPFQSLSVKYVPDNESGSFLDERLGVAGTERTIVLTFPQTSPFTRPISIQTIDDASSNAGVIKITLVDDSAPKTYTFADTSTSPSATVNITNLNPPTISISSSSETFTEAPGGTVTYTFTLSRRISDDVSIAYSVSSESSAEETNDYTLAPSTPLTIAGGSGTPATLTVTLADDQTYEGDETVILSLAATGAEFRTEAAKSTNHSLTITITDDEGKPGIGFKASAQTVNEGGTISLTIVASRPSEEPYSIAYTPTNAAGNFLDTSDGAPGAPASITSSFVRDETSGMLEQTFTIALNQDNGTIEEDGRVAVVLDPPEEAAPYAVDSAANTLTVTVEDAGGALPPTISFNDLTSVAEGETLTYNFMLDMAGSSEIQIEATVSGTVESSDYTAASLQETISSGTSGSISIRIEDDSLYEGDETLTVTFAATNAVFDSGIDTDTVTITDNERMPEISFNALTQAVDEGSSLELAMVASVLSEAPYSISYTPIDIDGNFLNAASDTSGTSRTVNASFALDSTGGRLEQRVTIATRAANGMDEDDGEISVNLDDPSGSDRYTINNSMRTVFVTVRDVDVPRLSIRNAPDVLAGGVAEFQVSSNIKPRSPLTVRFIPVNGTGNFLDIGSGAANSERTTTLTFPDAGPFTQTLGIRTTGDPSSNSGGDIMVTLVDDPVLDSYTLTDDVNLHTATANVSNPIVPSLSIADAMVVEEAEDGTASVMRFEVVLNPAATETVTVDWNTEMLPGGAAGDVDYSAGGDTLTFQPSVRSQFITVDILSDAEEEETELFAVNLSNQSSNAQIIRSRAIGAIADNDTIHRVSFSTGDTTVREGDSIRLRLKAKPVPESDLFVRMMVAETDSVVSLYAPRSVKFAAGSSSANFTITTVEDSVDDTPARIEISIVDGDRYDPGSEIMPAEQKVTITVEDSSRNAADTKYSAASTVIRSILSMTSPPETGQISGEVETSSPEVEISALDKIVSEGDPVRFEIATASSVSQEVTVNVNLADTGNFIGGVSSMSVNILKGKESAILNVPTVDDQIAEADGVVTAQVRQGPRYRISTRNAASVSVRDTSDREQKAGELEAVSRTFLPAILASSSSNSLDIVRNRASQAFSGGTDAYVDLGEFSSAPETSPSLVQSFGTHDFDWPSVIGKSSFAVNLAPDTLTVGTATFWGSGDHSEFLQNGDGHSSEAWSAETLAGHLGFDMRIGKGVLTGLASSTSSSNITLNYHEQEIEYGIHMSGLHSYAGLISNEGGVHLQVTAGYGVSGIERKQANAPSEMFDGSFLNFGLNGHANLLKAHNAETGSTTTANITGNTRFARQTLQGRNAFDEELQISAGHFQISAEGTRSMILSNGNSITPSTALGLLGKRKTGRDAFYATISNEIEYNAGLGLEVSVSNQMLMRNLTGVDGWRLQKSADYDSGHDSLGLLAGLSGSWHIQPSPYELEEFEPMNGTSQHAWTGQQAAEGFGLDTTVGYGIEILDGRGKMKPFSKFALFGNNEREYGIGSLSSINEGMDIEMTATYLTDNRESNLEYRLNGNLRW